MKLAQIQSSHQINRPTQNQYHCALRPTLRHPHQPGQGTNLCVYVSNGRHPSASPFLNVSPVLLINKSCPHKHLTNNKHHNEVYSKNNTWPTAFNSCFYVLVMWIDITKPKIFLCLPELNIFKCCLNASPLGYSVGTF